MFHHLPALDVCRRTLHLQEQRAYHIAACWRAESFRRTPGESMTVRRAMALNAVLEQCDLPLIPGELLIGSGLGRLAQAGERATLDDAYACLQAIGNRDFTTVFDHTAPDYPTVLQIGIGGLRAQAHAALAAQTDADRQTFLHSTLIALDGAANHIIRWAEAAEAAALLHPEYAELLLAQAEMLRRLSHAAPATFWEAVQLTLLMHAIFQLDERYAMALGRLDQYLYPFYQADLQFGRLTATAAQTILDHLFAKLAHRGDIQNICVGGVTPGGEDAVNPVSYLILEAVKRIGQPGGNLTARISAQTPDAFLHRCIEVIRTGIGFPALFNDEIEIPALCERGVPLAEARDYCFVGCIEVHIPGRQAPWSDSRFNLLRCVNLVLWDGLDTVTGAQLGPRTGQPENWDDFLAAYLAQMRAGVGEHIRALQALKQAADARAEELTSPLLSALTGDCLARALDQCAGGARHAGNHGVAGMGIGVTADALMAVKRFVYDLRRFTLAELREMLAVNFAGYAAERKLLLHDAPKYGNDDAEVDAIAVEVARAFAEECLRYPTPRGGYFVGLLAANVQNVSSGLEVDATPDGRLARQPLSDAASPTFGRDLHGPTALLRSIAKIDYRLLPAGNVINMKFHPSALEGNTGVTALAALVRTCFHLGGIQLQFNTTNRAFLRAAIAHPQDHRDLVVRVSGFSAYYTSLDQAVQEDILARTEHAL